MLALKWDPKPILTPNNLKPRKTLSQYYLNNSGGSGATEKFARHLAHGAWSLSMASTRSRGRWTHAKAIREAPIRYQDLKAQRSLIRGMKRYGAKRMVWTTAGRQRPWTLILLAEDVASLDDSRSSGSAW